MKKGIKGMVAVLLTAAELAEKVTSNSFVIGSYKYKKTVFKLAKLDQNKKAAKRQLFFVIRFSINQAYSLLQWLNIDLLSVPVQNFESFGSMPVLLLMI